MRSTLLTKLEWETSESVQEMAALCARLHLPAGLAGNTPELIRLYVSWPEVDLAQQRGDYWEVCREAAPAFTNAYDRHFAASGRKDYAGAVSAGIDATPEYQGQLNIMREQIHELAHELLNTKGRTHEQS